MLGRPSPIQQRQRRNEPSSAALSFLPSVTATAVPSQSQKPPPPPLRGVSPSHRFPSLPRPMALAFASHARRLLVAGTGAPARSFHAEPYQGTPCPSPDPLISWYFFFLVT